MISRKSLGGSTTTLGHEKTEGGVFSVPSSGISSRTAMASVPPDPTETKRMNRCVSREYHPCLYILL